MAFAFYMKETLSGATCVSTKASVTLGYGVLATEVQTQRGKHRRRSLLYKGKFCTTAKNLLHVKAPMRESKEPLDRPLNTVSLTEAKNLLP